MGRLLMDRVLEDLRPCLEPIARPYADPGRPVESTADLLQESCLRAWQKIQSFHGGENDDETFAMFRSWIGQIVRRIGLTAQRDRQRLRRSPPEKVLRLTPWDASDTGDTGRRVDPISRDPTPSANARTDERIQRVQAALERVSDETNATIAFCRRAACMFVCHAISRRAGRSIRYTPLVISTDRPAPNSKGPSHELGS